MDIASRITSIEEHIGNAYDSIKKFGVDTSVINRNIENIANVINDQIYSKLPTVTGSGSEFTLTPVQNGQVDDFKMIGTDLEQETVETITVSDWEQGTIYDSNGYLEQSNDEVRTNDFIEIFPNTLYYISRTIYTSYMKFRFYDEQKNYVGSQATATVTTNKSENRMQINESSMELTINDSNIKYMKLIDHSNDLSTVYTITTNATPSPIYPQEIKVVEGRQVITDKGKNLFDKDNATKGYYYSSTAIEESANWYIYQAPVKANTNYYLSGNNYSNVYARIWLLDESKNRISTIGDYKNTHLITTTDNTAYIGLSIADYNGTADMDTLQLEENSSATDYEPYHEPAEYNIDLTNDLLKYSKCDFTPATTSWYFLNGSGSAYGSNIGTKTDIKFPVEINKKYTLRYNISIAPNTFQLCYENENVVATLGKSSGNNTFTFTSDRNGYVIPRVQVNASSQVKITGISVVEGEEDYYDYKLAKMPNTDYKNRIYKNNGNWYYEENVKKVVLDGSENWYYVNNSSYSESIIRYRCDDFTDVVSTGYGAFILSSNFKGFPLGHRTENGIARQLDSSGLNIFIDKSITNNSLTNFKNWLSTNNVEVWYPLVNPVTTQITNTTLIDQLEAISVHTGTNIITLSSDNNMTPEIEITRLKELERLS